MYLAPRHRCIIMNEVVNESLREICHYQQNVPQHYYLLDTLVYGSNPTLYQSLVLIIFRFIVIEPIKSLIQRLTS